MEENGFQAGEAASPLAGPERSIAYLQNLGQAHLPLILTHAAWLLKEDPTAGLRARAAPFALGESWTRPDLAQVFTEDCEEVAGLDRDAVLAFLQRTEPKAVLPYLVCSALSRETGDGMPRVHV